jgi:hypothetical protein
MAHVSHVSETLVAILEEAEIIEPFSIPHREHPRVSDGRIEQIFDRSDLVNLGTSVT